jgi:tetratricopeptide (TPR) repeat protein
MQGRFAEATGLLQRAAVSDPLSLAVKLELAEHYEVLGQPDLARDALGQAVALAPDDYGLRSKLAHVLVRLGSLDEARDQYLDFLEGSPGHRPSLHALASLEAAQGKIEPALELLEQTLKAYPDSQADMELYADLLSRREPGEGPGKSEEDIFAASERAWINLLNINPGHAKGWYRLALLYENNQKPMQAEQAFLKGLSHSPDSFLLLDGAGRFYYRQDRFKDAERAFNVSHLANPMDAESLLFWA